jgi:Flp pilus assembly protein TadG
LCQARRGAAAAEFAVLLPLLAFLTLITVDFGRAIYTSITIDNCVHNAAIYGSQSFDNQNQQWISGDTQYWQGPNSTAISTEQAALMVDGSNLSPPVDSTMINISSGTDGDGNPVAIVTIQYPFQLLTPGLWALSGPVNLTRMAQMRIAPATPGN